MFSDPVILRDSCHAKSACAFEESAKFNDGALLLELDYIALLILVSCPDATRYPQGGKRGLVNMDTILGPGKGI